MGLRSTTLKGKPFVETPLPSLTVMFFLAGIVSILLGILAEVIMRTYYESQGKTTYLLREVRQGPPPDQDKPQEVRPEDPGPSRNQRVRL